MKRLSSVLVPMIVVLGIGLMLFPPRERMRRAVQDFGFRDVRLTGFALLGCSERDVFRQRWSGRNAAGRPVGGVVCGGIAKDWTVRLS